MFKKRNITLQGREVDMQRNGDKGKQLQDWGNMKQKESRALAIERKSMFKRKGRP